MSPVVWCPCRHEPEPAESWVYPDDWHADVHDDELEIRRHKDADGGETA